MTMITDGPFSPWWYYEMYQKSASRSDDFEDADVVNDLENLKDFDDQDISEFSIDPEDLNKLKDGIKALAEFSKREKLDDIDGLDAGSDN